MKFYGHNPKTHLLDLGGNPDLDPDPGMFRRNYRCGIDNGKGSSSWVRQQFKNTQASGPQIE